MAEEGRKVLESSGLSPEQITYQRTADMRYIGQGHEVSVPLPEGTLNAHHLSRIEKAFHETYKGLYGREGPDVPLEVINWRVVATGPRPKTNLNLAQETACRASARKGTRLAYFPECGGYVETPVYDRYALEAGVSFTGPAIIEERESTLIIGARGHARIDPRLNIIVEFTNEN
jgi:N-methylhydantoinase A